MTSWTQANSCPFSHAAAGDAARPLRAFEVIAYSSIKLARAAPAEELAMEPLVAEAILEVAEDLRAATANATGTVRSQ